MIKLLVQSIPNENPPTSYPFHHCRFPGIGRLENGDTLQIVIPSAVIQRYACRACGAICTALENKNHPFYGLDFIHLELFQAQGSQAAQFAAFLPR